MLVLPALLQATKKNAHLLAQAVLEQRAIPILILLKQEENKLKAS